MVRAAPAHPLHARRLYSAWNLHRSQETAGRAARAQQYRQCIVLPGGLGSVLWSGDRTARPHRADPTIGASVAAGDSRKAFWARPRIGGGPQHTDPPGAVRKPDLSEPSF